MAMAFLEQIIQLLSNPPGNVIYHLITLFSLQVIFALSFTQWRREPADHLMRRTMWAAAALFAGRLGLLLAGLVVANNPVTAVSVLPPLEQAMNTATAILITWALIPHFDNQPQLSDTIIIILMLVIGVMYIFFAQTWPVQALSGLDYGDTTQATMWAVLQLLTLIIAVVLTGTQRSMWFSLRQIILLLLLISYIIHLWANPDTISTQTNIAYWIRLGYLVTFPLWATLVYRYVAEQILTASPRASLEEHGAKLPFILNLSTQVISSLQPEANLNNAIIMAKRLLPADHISFALIQAEKPDHILITSNLQTQFTNESKTWEIPLADWPALKQALTEDRSLELTHDGKGARQLRLWYEGLEIEPKGPLLIEPMFAERTAVGLLLLSGKTTESHWSEADKAAASALASYFGQVLHNSHTFHQAADQITAMPISSQDNQQMSGRIISLEDERDQLKTALDTAHARLTQAESQASKASKQARDLAAALEELEQMNQDDRVDALETEIETLRESLIEAEEAMALAAADEKGLSTEWIMTTITRYSSQLEAAQARLQTLEANLAQRERGVTDELVISLAQELRTPMTSIAGYTELLLSEMLGSLGEKQRDFLKRVKANVERMDTFLDLIVQLTISNETANEINLEPVDVQTVVETAVSTVITQIREKNLLLDMQIQPNMPQLSVNRKALQQIISNLLSNACTVSAQNTQIAIRATIDELPQVENNGQSEKTSFMHMSVSDSGGGIHIDDLARVFDPQYRADNPLIDGLGETGAGLAVARTLTESNGGRVWIESNQGEGSTLSVLFPLSPNLSQENKTDYHINGTLV
ncbi:MAG: hypothetical protein CSA11_00995 [Chloroflexi bacterium]|nr:MAG: hypothetical protein CSA11_00995 [Chloroflexota bacterium]